jgi:hypothetical protein
VQPSEHPFFSWGRAKDFLRRNFTPVGVAQSYRARPYHTGIKHIATIAAVGLTYRFGMKGATLGLADEAAILAVVTYKYLSQRGLQGVYVALRVATCALVAAIPQNPTLIQPLTPPRYSRVAAPTAADNLLSRPYPAYIPA